MKFQSRVALNEIDKREEDFSDELAEHFWSRLEMYARLNEASVAILVAEAFKKRNVE